MVLRPISGWSYAGADDVSCWASLDGRFGAPLDSGVGIRDALSNARQRWGLARVACLTAGTSWAQEPPEDPVGFCYAKLGPGADRGAIRSAWECLERGAADAVWVRAMGAEFLVERTGDAPVGLRDSSVRPELGIDVDPCAMITAVVVGAAIVELGLRCAPGGVEPERVSVRARPHNWQLELRS